MNIKLQNKLFKKYPKIFRQRNLPMSQTCMCWGLECGDGWFWLMDKLCRAIQSYINNNKKYNKDILQLEATQIKEKFGGLRFYYQGGWDGVRGTVSFAEFLSYFICENCGSIKDVTQTKGWIYTLCKKCRKKLKK